MIALWLTAGVLVQGGGVTPPRRPPGGRSWGYPVWRDFVPLRLTEDQAAEAVEDTAGSVEAAVAASTDPVAAVQSLDIGLDVLRAPEAQFAAVMGRSLDAIRARLRQDRLRLDEERMLAIVRALDTRFREERRRVGLLMMDDDDAAALLLM
jgi:hypothetical protein